MKKELTYIIIITIILNAKKNIILCTIDVNLSEFEYLASHLSQFECRRLVAALHYDGYDLPKSISAAERKLREDISCLKHLLHWNGTKGKGKTHNDIEHRLRQLGHIKLANWLGKTVFNEVGNDIVRIINEPINNESTNTSENYDVSISDLTTTVDEKIEDDEEELENEVPWFPINHVMMAIMVSLLFIAILGTSILVFDLIGSRRYRLQNSKSKCRCKA